MGNPVEDRGNHKGLGMILASEHSEDQGKPKETEAGHSDQNSNGDLAATLQKSSHGPPSDRGYSYTEALFTGTPLLNGRPFTTDRTQSSQGHVTDPDTTHTKQSDKAVKSYKGAGLVDPAADRGNDGNKIEGDVPVQKEVHTEEGVTGLTVNKNSKEGQLIGSLPSKEETNAETNFLSKSPAEAMEHVKNEYPVSRPSLDETRDKSQENNNRHQGRESLDSKLRSDNSVEEMHQFTETGKTQENFENNRSGSGHLVEENKIINQIPLRANVKSYDEESNLLGSSNFNHGHLVHPQADHALEQRQDEANQNMVTGITYSEKAHSLKQRQEESNQPLVTEDSGNTESSQKGESSGTTALDLQSNGFRSTEKGTNAVSPERLGDIQESKGSPMSSFKESGDRQTEFSHEVPGRHPADQTREQPLVPGVKEATKDLGKQPSERFNDSMSSSLGSTKPSKGVDGLERFITQLRPHKIIESAFDEDLAQRIVTGPSYQQDSHEALSKQLTEKPSTLVSYPRVDASQSSSRYREGSNPSDFNSHNHELIKDQGRLSVQESLPSIEVAPLGMVSGNLKESAMQLDTSNQLSSTNAVDTRPDHQSSLTDNTGSHQEEGNMETLQENLEHGTKTHTEPSDNLIRPPGYTSDKGEAYTNISSSYREGSNPSEFSSTNDQKTEGRGDNSASSWLVSSESTQRGPLSRNHKDETAQQGSSHQLSEGLVHGTPSEEGTYTNGKGLYREHQQVETLQNNAEHASETNPDSSVGSPAQITNQSKTHKQILPTFYHQKDSDPNIFNSREESIANEHGVQSLRVSSSSHQKHPNTQIQTSDQMIPVSRVDTGPINGDRNLQQQLLQNSVELDKGQNYASGDYSVRPTPSGQRGFEVGEPEHANDVSVENQPKGINKDQQQRESNSERSSEKLTNDQQKESDHDNMNQKIVYFFKMAKGIPLLNNRPAHDQDVQQNETHLTGYQSTGEVMKEDSHSNSVGEMVSQWRWQRKLKPSPTPVPSPVPSPSSGEAGGAIGGSSVNSNVPQGK